MRKFSFLFFFVFSPAVFLPAGQNGSPEKDKSKLEVENLIVSTPKTVKEETNCDSLSIAIESMSKWQFAIGSYYDPKDTSQTRKDGDGIGAFERMIQSGSIALGSPFTKFFIREKDKIEVFFEVRDLRDLSNTVTPFGKGIFRLDDSMKKKKGSKDGYYLDFHEENLTNTLRRIGRFSIQFRIHRIQKIG